MVPIHHVCRFCIGSAIGRQGGCLQSKPKENDRQHFCSSPTMGKLRNHIWLDLFWDSWWLFFYCPVGRTATGTLHIHIVGPGALCPMLRGGGCLGLIELCWCRNFHVLNIYIQ